jgi:hypothetical protein
MRLLTKSRLRKNPARPANDRDRDESRPSRCDGLELSALFEYCPERQLPQLHSRHSRRLRLRLLGVGLILPTNGGHGHEAARAASNSSGAS